MSFTLRFYDVNDGFIRIGGIDIKDLKLSTLMSQISAVFQKVYLFNDTIENNILFGNPDATKEEVIRAAKQACCHDFIMKLPDGYKTVLHEKAIIYLVEKDREFLSPGNFERCTNYYFR